MENNNTLKRMVELENDFGTVWNSLYDQNVELVTGVLKTPFVARALIAKRKGSKVAVEVLVFLKDDGNGRLKECSRCYIEDWGLYFNHLGHEGQRIDMYSKAIDAWASPSGFKSYLLSGSF